MRRRRLAEASLIFFIVALFIHPISVHLFHIPDQFAVMITVLCFLITIILALLGKGIVRVMVFLCLAIKIIPLLIIMILGIHLDL